VTPQVSLETIRSVFHARSAAVVGASAATGKLGHMILSNLRNRDFPGPVYPVNPKERVILGLKAYPSLAAISEPIDLVIVTIPSSFVPEVIEQAASRGVRAAIIVSAGFSETETEEGRQAEERIRQIVQASGMALIGPNCQGVLSARGRISAWFGPLPDRVGKAVRTSPRDALLSESVPENQMGKAFGIHRTLDQLGAIVGPFLASALILFFGVPVRGIFWLSVVPGALALLVLLFVKERATRSAAGTKILTSVRRVLKGRFLQRLLVVGMFSIGAFNFSIILAKAEDIGVPDAIIPLVYATINITHVVIAIPSGMLSDKIGREKVLMIGYGAFLLSALLLSQRISTPAYIFLVALVYGLYMGVGETIQRAMIPRYAPAALKGTAYGVYYLVVGTGFFIANSVVGALWTYAGSAVAASYSVGTSIAAIVAMMLFLKREKEIETSHERA